MTSEGDSESIRFMRSMCPQTHAHVKKTAHENCEKPAILKAIMRFATETSLKPKSLAPSLAVLQRKSIAGPGHTPYCAGEGLKRVEMTDRDDGGCRKFLLEQTVEFRPRRSLSRVMLDLESSPTHWSSACGFCDRWARWRDENDPFYAEAIRLNWGIMVGGVTARYRSPVASIRQSGNRGRSLFR